MFVYPTLHTGRNALIQLRYVKQIYYGEEDFRKTTNNTRCSSEEY